MIFGRGLCRMFKRGLPCAVVAFLLLPQVQAQDVSIKDMLGHADRSRGNVDGIAWNVKMETFGSDEEDAAGSYSLKVEMQGNNSLAEFLSPPKSRGRMLLMNERNMWFIRPGLSKAIPISPRQKLIGMASNGDIASTDYVHDYEAHLLGAEMVQGEECYVLDLKAAKKTVSYDRIKYWVSKADRVGVRAEFYTLSGKLFKTAEFKYGNKIRLNVGEDVSFVSEMVIYDAILEDRKTILTYSQIVIRPIPHSRFSLNLMIKQ